MVVAHCPSTGMRVLESAMEDLDEEWVNDMLVDVVNLSGLPEEQAERVKAMKVAPIEKAKQTFSFLDRMTQEVVAPALEVPVDEDYELTEAEITEDIFTPDVEELQVEEVGAPVGDFEGIDVLELDEERETEPELDVDMTPGLEW